MRKLARLSQKYGGYEELVTPEDSAEKDFLMTILEYAKKFAPKVKHPLSPKVLKKLVDSFKKKSRNLHSKAADLDSLADEIDKYADGK